MRQKGTAIGILGMLVALFTYLHFTALIEVEPVGPKVRRQGWRGWRVEVLQGGRRVAEPAPAGRQLATEPRQLVADG